LAEVYVHRCFTVASRKSFGEPFSKFGNLLVSGGPVRIAGIAVEHECPRFQLRFELFPAERNRLVMIVRTFDFKIQALAHESDDSAGTCQSALAARKEEG
jgi:hypothetical protein